MAHAGSARPDRPRLRASRPAIRRRRNDRERDLIGRKSGNRNAVVLRLNDLNRSGRAVDLEGDLPGRSLERARRVVVNWFEIACGHRNLLRSLRVTMVETDANVIFHTLNKLAASVIARAARSVDRRDDT